MISVVKNKSFGWRQIVLRENSKARCSKARCSAAPAPSAASGVEKSSRSYSGGNPVCPRETPKWQKPITTFVYAKPKNIIDPEDASTSKSKPKRRVVYSDDEDSSKENNMNGANEGVEKERMESQVYDEIPEMADNGEQSGFVNAESELIDMSETDATSKNTLRNENSKGEINEDIESQVYEVIDYNVTHSPPKNRELDESIILEPLNGDDSHKIEEYYKKVTKKGKGVGKRSENNNRVSKRNLEEDESLETTSKRIRVD
ncbi:unnamed protein product [Leptosia nina]|uniref:PCNA-associated factor histone-like domain-containing protein n=1 Tax=Leptosia nina TaxID=320188 RepID=A0AAV1JXV4_9NEOP